MKVLITPNTVLYISLLQVSTPHGRHPTGVQQLPPATPDGLDRTTTGATTHRGLDPPPRRAANIQLDWNLWLSDSKENHSRIVMIKFMNLKHCHSFNVLSSPESWKTYQHSENKECRTLQHEICGYGLGCIKQPPPHCLHAWNYMFFHTPQSSKTTSSDSSAPVTVMLAPPGLSSIWGYPVRPVNHFHILGWSGFPSAKIKGWFIKPQVACTPPTKSLSKVHFENVWVLLLDCLSPRVPPLRKVFIAW